MRKVQDQRVCQKLAQKRLEGIFARTERLATWIQYFLYLSLLHTNVLKIPWLFMAFLKTYSFLFMIKLEHLPALQMLVKKRSEAIDINDL